MSNLLEQASLVMIPSGYKEDVVYSEIPIDGSGDLQFTRSSNGTRVNSAGLVEDVPWNLADDSNDFGGLALITKTTGQVSPIDSTSGNLLTATGSGEHYSGTASLTVVIGNTYTYSVYGKFVQGVQLALRTVFSNGDQDIATIWNLSTGALVANAGAHTNPTITAVGNGYYRCSITFIPTVVPAFPLLFRLQMALNGATSFTASSGDGFLAYGAQINNGALAPYFPTTDRLNVPRLTYQNGGGGCPSLLLEKQSTNDLTYSEDFSNVAWNNVRGVVTANSTISPDGTQNADTFASASGQAFPPALTRTPTFAGNTRYSLSIFAKVLGNTNIFSLGYVDNATGFTGGSAVYNLATQVVTITQSPNASVTASMQDYGNGWYRLVLSFLTIASPTFNYFQIGQTTNDVANAFALYGAQLEASSYPTSYIPTTSSSATRVADACFKTGISSLIGQTEGVVFWDIEVETLSATGNENILNIDAGSFGNTIYFSKGTTGVLAAEVYVTGVAQCSFSYSLPSVGRYKMALAYKSNDFAFYVNGVSRGTDSSGSVPTCSRLQMGNGALGSSDGKINQAVLFPTRLTNAELATLTTL